MNRNKMRAFALGIFFILVLTLLVDPVNATVGLEQVWTNARDLTYSDAFDISKSGDYVCAWISSAYYVYAGKDGDGTYINNVGGAGGGFATCAFKKNTDELFVFYTTDGVRQYDYINDVLTGTAITGLPTDTGGNSRLEFSYNDAFLIYSQYSDVTKQGKTTVIDMSTYAEDYSLSDIQGSTTDPDALYLYGLGDVGSDWGDTKGLYKYNIQTGVEVAKANLPENVSALGTHITSSNFTMYASGGVSAKHVVATHDFIYFGCYNSDDTSERYVIRCEKDLTNFEIVLDNSSSFTTRPYVDVDYNDNYLIVGAPNSANNMYMYDIQSIPATQIDTGTDGASCKFSEDASGVFACDMLDGDVFYYNTSYLVDTGGTGQGTGDPQLEDYSQRCVGALLYDQHIYEPEIEDYIDSFGDITIHGLELYIATSQAVLNTADPDDYSAYLNGVSIGSPDYLFQISDARWKMQWTDLSLNVGENDIILEFQVATHTGGYYWFNQPLGYTDTAGYGGTFGNGNFDGTSLAPLGLGTCVYYELNAPVQDENSYTITLLSTDPHWLGNTTRFAVTVDGDTPWSWYILDPDGNIVGFDIYTHGDNTFTITKKIPSYWDYGEYTFLAIDTDNAPTYFDTATNVTFNVSAYGGGSDVWYVDVVKDPIIKNDFQDVTYFVPAGIPYQIDWLNVNTNQWGTFASGTGDGLPHTLVNAFQVTDVGRWRVNLINRTAGWGQYPYGYELETSVYFDCVLRFDEYLQISESDGLICNTGTLTISGYYAGDVGTLYIKKDSAHTYPYPIGEGGISIAWNPDDDESAVGTYSIYIVSGGGDTLSWSQKTITVEDCTGGGGGGGTSPLPPLSKFYAGIGAIIIIGFFSTIPLLMSAGLNKHYQIKVPWVLYLIFAVIGVMVAVIIGWLDSAYLFFIVAIGIIIVVAMWLLGKNASSEGS